MGQLIHDERDGYRFISENGIDYDLLEGQSLNGETTSDILFIMLRDEQAYFGGDTLMVGWMYGATLVQEHEDEYTKSIEEMVDSYEEKNLEVVKFYGKKPMMERIRETVEAYYETNKEALMEYKARDIREQIEFLKSC